MFLDDLRGKLREKHYSYKTEQAYVGWAKRFILFHGKRHPREMGKAEIESFLTKLAMDGVSASTQNQALAALLFMYQEQIGVRIERVCALRAKKEVHLPTVLSKEEVKAVLCRIHGIHHIVAELLYGGGLRLMECLRLRVKDVDFSSKTITLRDTKSNRDRTTVLPDKLIRPLSLHLAKVKAQHDQDADAGFGSVELPGGLSRKYPGAEYEWSWQYVFPASHLSRDPRSGIIRRHHLFETSVQKAIRKAAREAGISKPVGPHTFRHSFATHLIHAGYDIRTIQELLGHKDVKTTMVYTHVTVGVNIKSPLDCLDISDPTGL